MESRFFALLPRPCVIILVLTLLSGQLFMLSLQAQEASHIALFDQYHRGDQRYSGSWVYVNKDNMEFALLGTYTGTAIYTIDHFPIAEVAFIPGSNSNWREITVIGDQAYVTTEGPGTGMQVIELGGLPDTAFLLSTYLTTFDRAHIIQRDMYSSEPFVYVIGTTTTEGVHIIDVSNPELPVETGLYNPDYYIHDAHVKNGILFAAAFYEATIDIVDISNKSNPKLVARIPDPGGNTHSSWLTEDNKYLFICDELDGLPARMFNVSDFQNTFEVANWTANPLSLVHNPYISGDYIYISHNTEGLRILDIKDPEVPVEVGYFDTWSGPSGGFHGLWSACPFLPSGKIVGGNREDGLYVWTFDQTKAGRFYGIVRDAVFENPLWGASITLTNNNGADTIDMYQSGFDGRFKGGCLPGIYQLTVELPGYYSYQINNLEITGGDSLFLDIPLQPPVVSIKDKTIPATGAVIFPNPTSDQFHLLSSFPQEKKLFTIWYNRLGVAVHSQPIPTEGTTIVNFSGIEKGMYHGIIKNEEGKVITTLQCMKH